GLDVLSSFRLGVLVGGADTATASFVCALASLLAAVLLPLLFGAHRKGFIELGCPGGSGRFLLKFGVALLEFGDSLLGGLQLTLYGRDQIDQSIGVDPSAEYIGLELLDWLHTCFLADSADCRKTCFTEYTATQWVRSVTSGKDAET